MRVGDYKLTETIGSGSTCVVRKGVHLNTKEVVAIKIFNKKANGMCQEAYDRVEKEISIMKLITHPHVLELIDVYDSRDCIYLVMEYLEGGELFDYLSKKGKLTPDEALNIFQQIISAVDHCHSYRICHRDIKPENLLLTAKHKVKIADFGMAAIQTVDKLLDISCGSPHYVSPEIISGRKYDGFQSDVWSCGIVLFALLTGTLPFDDPNSTRLLVKISVGTFKIPSCVPEAARSLLKRMLTVDPWRRISIQEIKRDPWFTSNGQATALDLHTDHPPLPKFSINGSLDKDAIFHMQSLGYFVNEQHIREKLASPSDNIEKKLYYLYIDRKIRDRLGFRRGASAFCLPLSSSNDPIDFFHPSRTIPGSPLLLSVATSLPGGGYTSEDDLETEDQHLIIANEILMASLSDQDDDELGQDAGTRDTSCESSPTLNNLSNLSMPMRRIGSTLSVEHLKLHHYLSSSQQRGSPSLPGKNDSPHDIHASNNWPTKTTTLSITTPKLLTETFLMSPLPPTSPPPQEDHFFNSSHHMET